MAFKNYFAASARRAVLRKKGPSDGRMTGAQFDRYVRQPFHERAFAGEMSGASKNRSYNVFDSRAVRNDLRGQRSSSNAAHLTTQNVLRQIKAENGGRKRVSSPNRKLLPIR